MTLIETGHLMWPGHIIYSTVSLDGKTQAESKFSIEICRNVCFLMYLELTRINTDPSKGFLKCLHGGVKIKM